MRLCAPAVLALALLAACSRPGADPAARTPPPAPVAVWSYLDLAGSAEARAGFLRFAGPARVEALYLGAGDYRPDRAEAWAGLFREADARGIGVSMVMGRAAWVRPAQREAALERVRAVRELAAARRRAGQPGPVSLQLDVEPYNLPDWKRDWETLAGQYLDLLEAVRAELGGELALWVDIPVWWDSRRVRRQGRTRSLAEWSAILSDQVVLMDYRNRTEAILAGARAGLGHAENQGRKVVLGLAVHCDRDPDNRDTSFCRQGHRALVKAMAQVHRQLAGRRGYGGLAVFTYEDWLRLD